MMLAACVTTRSASTNITQVTLENSVRHYSLKRNQSLRPTVDLDKLWTSVSEQTPVNAAKHRTGVVPITDVLCPAYCKVLGEGKAPQRACHCEGRILW
ncbi:unnamed protein product [Gulo gulo]|uniref:Large ribosomal subunit protein uL15 n=1 Tax=Gulo gulo TaxID=48420 RepID=A0A9X9LY29_GULGU|nr:unnamed protein product [Gulo gulo]